MVAYRAGEKDQRTAAGYYRPGCQAIEGKGPSDRATQSSPVGGTITSQSYARQRVEVERDVDREPDLSPPGYLCNLEVKNMDHEDEPQGGGDDREEERPGAPWLPPDDRLWRHPSEVRANPATKPPAPSGTIGRIARSGSARMWFVGITSGLVGAAVCAGVLMAAGAVPTQPEVVTTTRAAAPTTDPKLPGISPNLIGLLGMVEPSVVGVTVNGSSGVVNGSGVVVQAPAAGNESYIVTDSALFAEAGTGSQVQVTTNWGYVENATFVATAPASGIALLKAVLPDDVGSANLGSVSNIQTGEEVFSVGSLPLAASDNQSAYALGYINDTLSFIQPVNGASNALFSMLVANLPVVTTDYGGAIVDSAGNVLGITNQVPGTPDNLTYVTPIDTVMAEVSQMIKGGRAGAYPWLGLLQATDISGPGAPGLGARGAVQVESVASGSPVAKVGVADNDVITTLDGRSLPSVGALIEWLANARPGQVMTIGWLHNGRRRSASVTLGSQPASANPS